MTGWDSSAPASHTAPATAAGSGGIRVGRARLLSTVLTPVVRYMAGRYLRLSPACSAGLPAPDVNSTYTLYLHIPFCESLCPYCAFNRFLFDEHKARDYYRQLRREMLLVRDLGYRFASLYVGGGTPTILLDELCETLDVARSLFGPMSVSCETNPNHLSAEYTTQLSKRVHRLSVGVQSFQDDLLKQMDRFHKFGSAAETLDRIRAAAPLFPSLNVDMIFNLPHQTEAMLRQDIETVIACGAQQTTFYPLVTSPSLGASLKSSVGQVEYSREARYYGIVLEMLQPEFEPLSVWTFLRDGTRALLDEYIVDTEEYVGLGSGGFSYLDGTLYVNTFSLQEYARAIEGGHLSISSCKHYGKGEQMRYRWMMELFGLHFDPQSFKRSFGSTLERSLFMEMLFMRLAGCFSQTDGGTLRLTPLGKYLSLVMMREFFAGVNRVRDQARQALNEEERAMCALAPQSAHTGSR